MNMSFGTMNDRQSSVSFLAPSYASTTTLFLAAYWCKEALAWKDLVKHPVRTIACQSINLEEPAWRFTATTIYDKEDSTVWYYTKLTLCLQAPIEIENSLPSDIQFYLLLLQDDGIVGLKRSEYAIFNTNNPEDFPVENRLIMEDEDGLKTKLGLHFMCYPVSGGTFKIQIYCPYAIINKTGLNYSIGSKPFMCSPKRVAGQTLCVNASHRKQPHPFLFSHLEDDKRNGAVLRVGFQMAINFDVVGANQKLTLQTSTKRSEYHVGLNVSEGIGKFQSK
ncbi:hypothetical protein O181_068996 [Austropuccinia psidii MF-1]|uniref:Vacuolar protein sorting-associated protein 13 VPS13 adaptor binding domain-containing protein n=1 Tax=Austropuccinia psidii MF-1 TaxID=1389203 RepID=A0A9Q3F2N6_9BASI|nr:hypothetical protein [Austropuccinia psidii MF-1]